MRKLKDGRVIGLVKEGKKYFRMDTVLPTVNKLKNLALPSERQFPGNSN